jgi:hypothetical protein
MQNVTVDDDARPDALRDALGQVWRRSAGSGGANAS